MWLIALGFAAAAASDWFLHSLTIHDKFVTGMRAVRLFHHRRKVSYPESWSLADAIGHLCTISIALPPSQSQRYASKNVMIVTLALTGFLLNSLYGSVVLASLASRYQSFHNSEALVAASFEFGFANTNRIVQYCQVGFANATNVFNFSRSYE